MSFIKAQKKRKGRLPLVSDYFELRKTNKRTKEVKLIWCVIILYETFIETIMIIEGNVEYNFYG